MINWGYFTGENLKIGFKINLDSRNNNHVNSQLTSEPSLPEFGIELRYFNTILKEFAVIYARLINQCRFQ